MTPKTLIRFFYYNNEFQLWLSIKIPCGAFKTFSFKNTISNLLIIVFAGRNLFTYFFAKLHEKLPSAKMVKETVTAVE